MILKLAENKILCLDDLAELDSEELLVSLANTALKMKLRPAILLWPRACTGLLMKTLLTHLMLLPMLKLKLKLTQ